MEGYLAGTDGLNHPPTAGSSSGTVLKPTTMQTKVSPFEWGTSLSGGAQTTLYYLTIPTEGYLISWTPFATRPTPTSTIHKVLTSK